MMQYFLMSLTLGFVHLSEQEVHEHRVAGIALEQKAAHFRSMGKEATDIVKDVIAGATAGLAAKGAHDVALPEGQESKGSYLASGAIGATGGATAYLGEHAARQLMPQYKKWADPARRALAGAGAAATDMFVAEHDIASASGAAGIFAGTIVQPTVGLAEDFAEDWWNKEEKSDVQKAEDKVKEAEAAKKKAETALKEAKKAEKEALEKTGDKAATDKQKKALAKAVETAKKEVTKATEALTAAEAELTKAKEAAKKAKEEDPAKKCQKLTEKKDCDENKDTCKWNENDGKCGAKKADPAPTNAQPAAQANTVQADPAPNAQPAAPANTVQIKPKKEKTVSDLPAHGPDSVEQ